VRASSRSQATRAKLLERALKLFQKKGVAATTMRDIARAAGMSLGAAYYYFPSKQALLFAYYEANVDAVEAVTAKGSLRERLGAAFHGMLDATRPHRALLASIVPQLADPADPLSAFSSSTRAVRERSVAVYARALAGAVPDAHVPLIAHALWLLALAVMLVFVRDDSANQTRTHRLVDDALDLLAPLAPLFATPLGRGLVEHTAAALARAEIFVEPPPARHLPRA